MTVEQGRPAEEQTMHPLIQAGIEDAISRLRTRHDKASELRIKNGVFEGYQPHVLESEDIAKQRTWPKHKAYLNEQQDFLKHVVEGVVLCPDGRNDAAYLYGGPGEIRVHRRLGGIPDLRDSTSEEGVAVVNDPDLSSGIDTAMEEIREKGFDPELVEYSGPHLLSTDPSHGCGYLSEGIEGIGHIPEIGMRHGGIKEYIDKIQDPLITSRNGWHSAFRVNAQRAGGEGAAFFVMPDHYSQGLIVAPPSLGELLDPHKSLRENLEEMNEKDVLLMSESLDAGLHQTVRDRAESRGQNGAIANRDYRQLVSNSILIGKIAMEITRELEKEDFRFIPQDLLKDASQTASRALAFRLVRNSVFRILSGLTKGKHPLMRHPEQFVRAGSSGGEYNSQYVPFVQRTQGGRLSESDIRGTIMLYGLLTRTLKERGVNLEERGRLITVTGEINPADFKNPQVAERYMRKERAHIANNAAIFRELLKDSVETGETIVLGVLFNSATRTPIEIVGKR